MLHIARWKLILTVVVCVLGIVYAVPNVLPLRGGDNLPAWIPNKTVNLGLDLQGGSHLLLEVEVGAVIQERLTSLVDSVRSSLREAQIRYTGLGTANNAVTVKILDPDRVAAARDILRKLDNDIETNVADDGTITLALTEQAIMQRRQSAVQQSIEIIRRRVDELGTREPTIQQQGADRILVQLPGLDDPERMKSLIGQTAKLTFHLVEPTVSQEELRAGRVPPGVLALPSTDPTDAQRLIAVRKRVNVSGDTLVDAQPTFQDAAPVVSFKFDSIGARRFAETTRENVGRNLAIVLDNKVISAPVIREPILGGSGIISGSFTVQQANDLALLLRAGALPAPLKILEERTVGPGLGADSIAAGTMASIVAAILVAAFMIIVYRFFGLLAVIALSFNFILLIAVLSVLQATLTLPGIAGIALTLGMAVDANVLIFERIREEARLGRGILGAIDAGFDRAFATILDSNLTTLFAAGMLFFLGSGPVKGFGVTLTIGLLTSMFSAILLVRVMIVYWMRWMRPKELPLKSAITLVRPGTRFGFMKWRKVAYLGSALLIAASLGVSGAAGFNTGVDFRGGILMELRTPQAADIGAMRGTLGQLGLGEVALQEFGGPNDVLIRVQRQEGGEEAQQAAVSKVRSALPQGIEYRRVEFVGPQVGAELIEAGTIASILSILVIAGYVWLRFEWQFGVISVIALLHDVITTIGLYALFQIEFNLTSIAAILTVAGYSINDTVVIFDRIRENLRKYKQMPLTDLIDLSLNETLSRTILTGGSTTLALLALTFLGGPVLAGFSIAILWGVIIGTYSSIYLAAPLLLQFKPPYMAVRAEKEAAGAQEAVSGPQA